MQILCKLRLTRFSFLKFVIVAVTRFYYFHLCAVALGFTTVYAYNYAILDYINAFVSKQDH